MSLLVIMCSLLLAIFSYCLLKHLVMKKQGQRLPLPPGPKPWPIIGNLPHMGPMPHHNLAALARSYGPLLHLRLGFVDVVVAASAAVAEQFLKIHDSNFCSRPPNAGAKYIAYNYHDMVFSPYGPRWRLLRKISSLHLFSAKALDDYRHVRQEEVAALVLKLASSSGRPVRLGQLLNICTANTLGRVILGRRVFGDGSGGSDPKADEFKSMVVEVMVLTGMFNIGDFIPVLQWLDLQGIVSKMKKLHKKFDKFFGEVLEEHKRLMMMMKKHGDQSEEKLHADMLSTLISLETEEAKLSDTDIKAVLLDMFLAGTDTSSSTIEWGIAELICHPKIMSQIQQELDSVVGKDRLVSELDLPKLTYLQAFIKETFRHHPSAPLSVPRIAAESCEINGYHIPKGSTLLVNIWAIGHDPNEWSVPQEFRPERYLATGEKADVDVKGNDFEVIPFGAGRRICADMSLRLRMVQLITATLAHAFDFELPEGLEPETLNMKETYGLTLQRLVPLMVHPKPRLSNHAYRVST
ncbi:hypothetical protein DITRI_Ditri03aG0103400 [Diplodiscus trichospermus]